ncbi:GGDEF domain-containing protein [Cupriavidus basilensis]|uniref:GGDEF domain-containing protein n=1 Tax=Cupriavidus basilensis TaxID=68895 RepID=A0ABT6B3L7_9BURK|nr:GGDEF domain-containing protein [Cupriavidus basilensis]MDF3838571.1 GGDEF domain-containing protein [Cupriavidus basilensis]
MTSFTFDAVLASEPTEFVPSDRNPNVAADVSAQDAWALLEASGGLALRVDASGNILLATLASAQLLAYPREYLLKSSILDVVSVEQRELLSDLLRACDSDGSSKRARLRFSGGLSEGRWLDLRISPGTGHEGAPHLCVFGYDVTQWVINEKKFIDESFRDPLTGVGNRALMRKRIAEYCSEDGTGTASSSFAVALMDLDGFKKVNDSLGHEFGDALLKQVSVRLQGAIRPKDVVARLGGDEFVLLLDGVASETAATGILERIIHACRQPFHLAGCQIRVTTSIGLAFGAGSHRLESQLLKCADLAMYEAKARGKNRYCVYSPELEHRLDRQFRIEQEMFQAVQNGEFLLHYQPIVWPDSGKVCAVEALMRWEHPTLSITPDVFIPVAEHNGLINHLGAWALRCACAQLAAWDAQGIHIDYVSVNVSPVQFLHPGFADSVRKAIADSGVSASRLVLEITEGALMTDPEAAQELLVELRALGVRFAVDDFGTGYSSLSYLRQFPLSALKIDRSFVTDMMNSPHAKTIVFAVLSLARELGLVAIAEGVETQAQNQLLVEHGCELVQGWYYSKALSPAQFEHQAQTGQLLLGTAQVFSQ